MWGRRIRAAGVALTAATLMITTTGCGLFSKDDDRAVIENYVTGVQVIGDLQESQQVVGGQLGAGEEDGPAAQVPGVATVVNGGSVREHIASEQAFTVVRVALEELATPEEPEDGSAEPAPAPTSTGAPATGYHEIKLREASTAVDLVLTVAQAPPGQLFVLYFAVADEAGKQGPLATQTVEALEVGTGSVQVSVSWDVDSDLDLHVVDPTGFEIYYGELQSDSGGELDLDSNPDCEIDGTRNENVTWREAAPPGVYTVLVDLYAACGVSPTNYVVTVQVAGQPSQTYTGSLTGEGTAGTSPIEVTTFEVPEAAPETTTG